ncbi:MAG: hypothetical protein DMD44_04575 [Gemmatimonadetes bacterium]|nr:MAG: hypothetical protein DMD44_04575 [Gemmatimonadota bacterium]
MEEYRLLGPGHVRRLLSPALGLDSREHRVRRGGVALRRLPRVKLLAFVALAVFVHGPLSPFLPTAFEATLLYYARFYPAWLLALVGTAGASLAEAVNYRLVDWAAALPKLAALRTRRVARWSIAAFLRAPFWTTVLVIFSPIPDSAVRILAPLGKYPLPLYLSAVALGRFPRLLLIAGSGSLLRIPLVWLLVASGLVALVILAWQGLRQVTARATGGHDVASLPHRTGHDCCGPAPARPVPLVDSALWRTRSVARYLR